MTVVTRFAPSPTGRLHVGNIRTALHNYLFARKNGGTFILRIDDTDQERSTAAFDQAIRDDLEWLGLVPDKSVRQSERFDVYEREFERLKQSGRATKRPKSLNFAARFCSGGAFPPFTNARTAGNARRKAVSPTGVSGSITTLPSYFPT